MGLTGLVGPARPNETQDFLENGFDRFQNFEDLPWTSTGLV